MEDHERIFDMTDPIEKRKLLNRIGTMTGKWVVGAYPYKPRRSNRANAFYWAAIIPAFARFMHSHGTAFSKEEVHEFLLQQFANREVVNPISGEVIAKIGRRSSKMNTEQFSAYVNSCMEWMEEKFGIILQGAD